MNNTTEVLETIFKIITQENDSNYNVTEYDENITDNLATTPKYDRSIYWIVEEYQLDFLLYKKIDLILYTIVMPIVIFIGLIGNIAIIYAFLRVPSLRTVTNYYLISLAIADVSHLFMWIYLLLERIDTPVADDYSHMNEIGCKVFFYFLDTFQIVSCFIIVVVSFERYLAICMPINFRAMRKASYAAVACLSCWLLAALVKLPTAIFVYQEAWLLVWDKVSTILPSYPEKMAWCYYCNSLKLGCVIYTHFDQISYLCAIPFLATFFILIIRELKQQEKSSAIQKSSLQRNKQVVRLLLVTVIVYVLCVAPFRISTLLLMHGKIPYGSPAFWPLIQAGRVALVFNSAINPIIYSLTSRNYRQSFFKAFPFTGRINAAVRGLWKKSQTTQSSLSSKDSSTRTTNLQCLKYQSHLNPIHLISDQTDSPPDIQGPTLNFHPPEESKDHFRPSDPAQATATRL